MLGYDHGEGRAFTRLTMNQDFTPMALHDGLYGR